MFRKSKLLSSALCIFMILSILSACSSSTSSKNSSSTTKKNVPVQIQIWYPWSSVDGDVIKKWAEDFSKTHPNIKVSAQMVPGSGIGASQGKFQAAVAGGNPPDAVLYWGYNYVPSLAVQNLIEPLDNLLASIKEDGSKFNETCWKSVQYKGKIYALPEMTSNILLFWNKDIFKKAGLDPDKPPTNLEELDNMAQKLTLKQNGRYVQFGFIPWIGQGNPLFWAGVFDVNNYIQDDKPNLEGNVGLEKVLEWEVSYSKKYDPKQINKFFAALSQNSANQNDPFVLGKVAMKIDGTWAINAMKQYAPNVNYGVAPVPKAPEGKEKPSSLVENVWMIPKGAKHPKEVLQFIEWTNEPQRNADAADKVFNLSPVKEALKLQKLNDDPKVKVSIDIMNNGHMFFTPQSNAAMAVDTALGPAFQAAQYLQKLPKDALKQAQLDTEKALKQQVSQ